MLYGPAQGIPAVRIDPKLAGITESLKPCPGYAQLEDQKAIQPQARRLRDNEFNLQNRAIDRLFIKNHFTNIDIGKLIYAMGLAPQGTDIEFLDSHPFGLIGLHCIKDGRACVADAPALENCPVPCFATGFAFIDKPCVQFLAVGIEPDLAAGLERLEAAASAAHDPRLRGGLRDHGPLGPKGIAHAVLTFRQEVHQESGTRSLLWARNGGVYGKEPRYKFVRGAHVEMPNRSQTATR
jgi:hypothetical protein